MESSRGDGEGESVELNAYLRFLRKRWLSIAALTLLATLGAVAATALSTPQYEATTTLFATTPAEGTSGDLAQGGQFIQQRVQSYSVIVTSSRVMENAIADLGLDEDPSDLAARTAADAPFNTALLNITVTDASPDQAAQTANAIGSAFIEVVTDLENTNAEPTSPVTVSTIDVAEAPREPSSPNARLNIVLGVLVGLAIGVGVALLRESLDTSVRGEDDVTRAGLPVLASTPLDPRTAKAPLVMRDAPHSVRAESFRQLRTNLQFVFAADRARSMVITSPTEGEGKTTTATNLALTLAMSGTRVVLVDADLRRPMVAHQLGLEGSVGLTTVLVGEATLEDVLQPWGDSGRLSVLASGPVPPNPSELLASEAMLKVVRELEGAFDVVVLDGAPLLPVTDSAVLAGIAGGALLVVASGRTTRPQLERAVASLQAVDARVLGSVLTMVAARGVDAYTSYGYAPVDEKRSRRSRRGEEDAS